MKFSICIPTHRVDRRLFHTLKSLESLHYPRNDYEICVMVNGTDCNLFSDEKMGMWDQLSYTPKALGPSEAKNEVFKMARHDWIVLLDSDDFLVPTALNHYSEFVKQNPGAVLGLELSVINLLGEKKQKTARYPDTPDNYRRFFNTSVSTLADTSACGRPILFNKKHLLPFDKTFPFAEERKLALDYWKAGYPTHLMGTCTYIYNWNETGVTHGRSLHELHPDERAYFEKFTNWIKNEQKQSNAFADNSFQVPGKEDKEAIEKFLAWENGVE